MTITNPNMIKVGDHDWWEPQAIIEINATRWLALVESVEQKGELEKFKLWLNGKYIKFIPRAPFKIEQPNQQPGGEDVPVETSDG